MRSELIISIGLIVLGIIILIAHAVSLSNARARDMEAKYAREQEAKHRRERIEREREQQIMQRNRIAELERMKRANESIARREFINKQRRLMTDSLRYDVMARDGFRCQLCGATAKDGVKLHVDHIMPVSKGGKTELSNLRTLCERCNLGKRDKIEDQLLPNGYDDISGIANALHDKGIEYALVKTYMGYAIQSNPSVDRFMQNAPLRKGSLQRVSNYGDYIWIIQKGDVPA